MVGKDQFEAIDRFGEYLKLIDKLSELMNYDIWAQILDVGTWTFEYQFWSLCDRQLTSKKGSWLEI